MNRVRLQVSANTYVRLVRLAQLAKIPSAEEYLEHLAAEYPLCTVDSSGYVIEHDGQFWNGFRWVPPSELGHIQPHWLKRTADHQLSELRDAYPDVDMKATAIERKTTWWRAPEPEEQ